MDTRPFEQYGKSSGVTVQCRRPCRVLTSVDWEYRLGGIKNSIVFLDEGNEFVKSEAFARSVRNIHPGSVRNNRCAKCDCRLFSHHNKRHLNPAYLHSVNVEKVLHAMESEN